MQDAQIGEAYEEEGLAGDDEGYFLVPLSPSMRKQEGHTGSWQMITEEPAGSLVRGRSTLSL